MDRREDNAIELDLKDVLIKLLHKLWIIILAGIIGAVIAGAYSYYMFEPSYSSTAKVYVINRLEKDKLTINDLQTGLQLTKDYMILVKSRPVTEQVIKKLNLSMSNESLAGMIDVNTPEDTRILEIKVKYSNPDMAKKIVDTVASISSEQMVKVMEIEKVNIVELGNLSTASGPNIKRDAIYGGLAGIGVILIIFAVLYLINDTVNTAEDIERYLGITTLGTMPLEEGYRKNQRSKKNKERFIALES
jgi:capsular polysaccharide biosynthesis protein